MSRPFNAPDVFRVIAHPARRRILDLLRARDRTPSELKAQFRLTRPAVSQHLRALRMSGLVTEHRSGRGLRYSLSPSALVAIASWIKPYQSLLQNRNAGSNVR